MIDPNTLKFLTILQKNNNKPWFDEHKQRYLEAKENFVNFVAELLESMCDFDKSLLHLEPKNCCFRINRDVRFSKNKMPYKNNMAAYINETGKKGEGPGYYFHMQPGKSFLAAGIWMPNPENLARIRQEIDYNYLQFKKIINNNTFKNEFPGGLSAEDKLKRPPKGYEESNPAIDVLKNKSFIVTHTLSDKEILNPSLTGNLSKSFKLAFPFIRFLKTAIGEI
ncbi:MAG: DUF2461 domain-containing protein [Niastella sp.]|nr:DUF2461 domain-containing protein [Niastella sp.]